MGVDLLAACLVGARLQKTLARTVTMDAVAIGVLRAMVVVFVDTNGCDIDAESVAGHRYVNTDIDVTAAVSVANLETCAFTSASAMIAWSVEALVFVYTSDGVTRASNATVGAFVRTGSSAATAQIAAACKRAPAIGSPTTSRVP